MWSTLNRLSQGYPGKNRASFYYIHFLTIWNISKMPSDVWMWGKKRCVEHSRSIRCTAELPEAWQILALPDVSSVRLTKGEVITVHRRSMRKIYLYNSQRQIVVMNQLAQLGTCEEWLTRKENPRLFDWTIDFVGDPWKKNWSKLDGYFTVKVTNVSCSFEMRCS